MNRNPQLEKKTPQPRASLPFEHNQPIAHHAERKRLKNQQSPHPTARMAELIKGTIMSTLSQSTAK